MEAIFAQRLAANVQTVRNRALRKLEKWITARSAAPDNPFTEMELLRLWKGLFYSMWMADKPPLQEELARRISALIHSFTTPEGSLLYLDTFLFTISREWWGIDQWRMDKFMMFVRTFLAAAFEFVSRHDWDESLVASFVTILKKSVINGSTESCPPGLQIHFADVFVEQLLRSAAGEVPVKRLTVFFEPYCQLLAETKNNQVFDTVVTRVFEYALRVTEDSDDEGSDEEGDGEQPDYQNIDVTSNQEVDAGREEEDEEDEEGKGGWNAQLRRWEQEALVVPKVNFDYDAIAQLLLQIGSTATCKERQRRKIYGVVQKYREMAKGVFPLDRIDVDEGRDLEEADMEEALERLMADDDTIQEETLIWKKDRKKALKELTNVGSGKKLQAKKRATQEEWGKWDDWPMDDGPRKKSKKQHRNIETPDTSNGRDNSMVRKNKKQKKKRKPEAAADVGAPTVRKKKKAVVRPQETIVSPQKPAKTNKIETNGTGLISREKLKQLLNKKSLGYQTSQSTVVTKQKIGKKKMVVRNQPDIKLVQQGKKQKGGGKALRKKRRVSFQLSQSEVYDAGEYASKLKTSPSVPYNAQKTPLRGVLKSR